MDERADLLVDAAEAADGNASDVSASMDFGFARIISGGYQSGQGRIWRHCKLLGTVVTFLILLNVLKRRNTRVQTTFCDFLCARK